MHTQEEIEHSKLELADSLKRLTKNKDFKKIILEGFLEHGTINLTKNYTKIKPEYKEDVVTELNARSLLWRFLDNIEEEASSILEARAYTPANEVIIEG